MKQISIADIAQSTTRIEAYAATLSDSDVRQPSALPAWSVGHVLSHIAFNADAFVNCAAELRARRPGTMYPDGIDARSQAIEAGSSRPANQIVTHLRESSAAFAVAWAELPPTGPCATAPGMPEFSSDTVLQRRLREVEVHGTDTGCAALSFNQWSEPFVSVDLPTQWAFVTHRTNAHFGVVDETNHEWRVGEPIRELVPVKRSELLAWLLDRHALPGLPTLLGWGDQSRWKR